MRKNGKAILLVAVLMCVMGTVRMNAQTGFAPVQTLTAYDNVGRRIGNVLGFAAAPSIVALPNVAFSKDNTTVVLGLGKNRFFSTAAYLAFTSTDCTGTAFIETDPFPGTPLTLNVIRDGAVYVPDASALPPFLPMIVRSNFQDNIEVPTCVFGFEYVAIGPVQAKILGNLPAFTPPFSVR